MKTLFLFTLALIVISSSAANTTPVKNLEFFWGSDPTIWDTNYGKLGTILQCTNGILGFYHAVSFNLVYMTMWALTIGFYGSITYTSMIVISSMMAQEVFFAMESYKGF